MPISPVLYVLGPVWAFGLIATGLHPYDHATWLMEVAPVLIVWPILWFGRDRLRFTDLVYGLILLHGLVLMVGGHYSYARVPLGFWMENWFGWTRNNYDKIGHFLQGFTPAAAFREILIGRWRIRPGRAAFLTLCIALAGSACYELIEWGAAMALGQGADDFLGTQGDPWDTQTDMLMALIGAAAWIILFARLQNRAVTNLS